jgi:hypothetical protein
VQFDVVEWNTLYTNWRLGAKDQSAHGANAINVSFASMDPFFAMTRFVSTKAFPPTSNNWGYYSNPKGACSRALHPDAARRTIRGDDAQRTLCAR